MSKALLPSDELHFLRWFWRNAIYHTGEDSTGGWIVRDDDGAIEAYEDETGRNAPGDYKARAA